MPFMVIKTTTRKKGEKCALSWLLAATGIYLQHSSMKTMMATSGGWVVVGILCRGE